MKKVKGNSLAKRNFQKLMANKLAIVGVFLIVVVMLACFLAPYLTPYDPLTIDTKIRNQPPSAEHLLGTDSTGRDIFTRLLYGGRLSIIIGLVSSLATNALGVLLGCVSGYFGKWVDKTLIFFTEVLSCFPQICLCLVLMALLGQGIGIMFIVFISTGWMGTMRMVRSRVLSLKTEAFVESCKANGIPHLSIMLRHMVPNTLGIIIINVTSGVAGFILSEAGMSFLGIGVPKGTVTWGNMLNAARSINVMQNYPLHWLAPGIAIALVVLGINFLGDGLRDVFDVKED